MATLASLLFALLLIAAVISIIFGLPGTLFIFFASLIYAIFTGFEKITGGMLVGLGLLTLCGEGLEYLFGIVGARRFGSSAKGVVFSIIGGFAGAMIGAGVLFGLGAVLGAFAGAFLGAVLVEILTRGPSEWKSAIKSGVGSFLGRVAGMVTKIALAIGMVVWILFSVF